MSWQPISTAPKDGTFIDLWVPCYGDDYREPDCFWLQGDKAWKMVRGGVVPYPPSHWMQIPIGPAASVERAHYGVIVSTGEIIPSDHQAQGRGQ